MRKLNTKEAIENAVRVLLHSGKKVRAQAWQAGQPINPEMIEICNVFLSMSMSDQGIIQGTQILAEDTGADLPWAEDHFQERISGSSNPGEQYKNWPHCNSFTPYLKEGKFSHTYQERFWPPHIEGIRYKMGDWVDVKRRLCEDVFSRQVFLSIWHPEDQSNNGVRVPCSIGYWFKVNGDQLDLTYLIRSCDARRHFRNDVYMAQRLAKEMAIALNRDGHSIKLGDMNMWIGSFHCFPSDVFTLKKQLIR